MSETAADYSSSREAGAAKVGGGMKTLDTNEAVVRTGALLSR
jgi:hypothetical protein